MRNAFVKALCEEARRDKSIWLLCADIGFSVLESFAQEFPERYINVGVAEQNMIGVAAGLALTGKNVFTYTIGNFSFMRCLEQIRNDVSAHKLNVKVVAVGGGFAYGNMGYTHHVIEDLAMMRSLPNTTLLAPGDPVEAALCAKALCNLKGPAYVRLGRGGETVVHTKPPEFILGKAIVLQEGKDAAIISSAGTLDIAAQAAADLTAKGKSVTVVSMPSLSPLDTGALQKLAGKTAGFVTIEEHGNGGLGSLVSEFLTDNGIHTPLRRIFIRDAISAQAGDRTWLRNLHGITADAVVKAVESL